MLWSARTLELPGTTDIQDLVAEPTDRVDTDCSGCAFGLLDRGDILLLSCLW